MVYIERVSMRGFKSFGNQRVSIPLSKGFTAIVGPNGAGKSNVVDGICFVLGRMSSKSMRAEKFSDLIWAGNERFPAGSYTEVSLHLNNLDRKIPLDEPKVIVSRRADRSGRCVYRASKSRVTRNEVVDLLSMANIFPEGYNIVLQGDITRLVKMTSVERRMLVDELSGIAEYDMKKERSMKELTKAEENIRATNLVIDEVLSQLRRLERERDEAVRYQEIQTQVRELRWQLQYNQLRKDRERYNAILERTKKGSDRIAQIEAEITQLSTAIQKEQDRQDELQRTIEKRQEIDMERLGKQIEEARAQIVRAQENLKNTNDNLERQKQAVARLEEEKGRTTEKIKDKRNKVKVLEGQRQGSATVLESLRSKQTSLHGRIAKLEDENSTFRDELAKVELKLKDARAADTIARQRSSQAAIKLGQAREELAYLQRSCQDQSEGMAARKAKQPEERKELAGLEARLSSLTKEAEKLGQDVDKATRSLSEVSRELEEKSSKEVHMEAFLKAAQEGQNPVRRAVSFLLQRKEAGDLAGIIGTVSGLAKVADCYRVPISAATGPLSDYIVVKDREMADRCIRLLTENKAGWANFIPLRELERVNSKPSPEFLRKKGIVGLALDLVEFGGDLKPVYEFVLGSTLVTNDLESSDSLPKMFRTVTMDGEVVDPSGIVSGGFYDLLASGPTPMLNFSEGDLTTVKAEAKGLRDEKKGLSEDLEEIRSQLLDTQRKRAEVQASIEGRRQRSGLLEREIEEIDAKMQEMSSSIRGAEERLAELTSQAQDADAAAKKAAEELARVERDREQLLRKIESPELKESDKEARVLSAAMNEKMDSQAKMTSEVIALQREIDLLEESTSRGEEQLKEAKQAVAGLQIVRDKMDKDIPNLEKELVQLSTSQQDIRDGIQELKRTLYDQKQAHSELVQRRTVLVEDKNRLSVDINSSVYERSQLDIEIHQLEEQLSLAGYECEPLEIDNLEELSRRITVLEADKSKLEPVNMRAIEAYEETEAKFNEYKEKRDKVMEEREAILQFMNEIEAKKRQVFMEAFNSIAANFERIFAKLSPGGVGRLLLENNDDPFQGGLDIQARPAGKEVNAIDSMSGGEKALTALAFIFAVQAYKPSPFYILDEIDAHLDDDNVKRVAELISETSKESQFVVVTLRDSMMAQADELIGVSMDESGVSKVVGVRLEAGRLVEGGVLAEAGGDQE